MSTGGLALAGALWILSDGIPTLLDSEPDRAFGSACFGTNVSPPSGRKIQCEHSKLNTEDADPLGRGAAQVQFNFTVEHSTRQWDNSWDPESRDRARNRSTETVIAYGVTDDLDIGAGSAYSWLEDDESDPSSGRGPADSSLGAKWRVLKAPSWALAIVPSVTIPSGRESTPDRLGPSQEFWSFDARLAVVRDWSERWSSNLDAGYEAAFGEDREDFRGSFRADAAIQYHLLDRVQPELEINYTHDVVAGDKGADVIAVTAGFDLPLSDRLCVRLGAQRPMAGRNVDDTVAVQVSVDLNF